MLILSVVLVIVLFISIDYAVEKRQMQRALARKAMLAEIPIDEIPAGLFLQKGHIWQQVERDGQVRMGADMLPISALGDVDYVEVAQVGEKVKVGDPIVVLSHKGKDIVLRSHTEGVVRAVNAAALDDPAGISEDPYGDGWLVKMEPMDTSKATFGAKIGSAAREWIREEFANFRDMLANLASSGMAPATLQDGGLPAPGLSEHLDEESWKRVANWISDTSRS